MIAIIDYGMGNIHSVKKALELYGAKTKVSNNPREISSCRKIILPGVGAFGEAAQELEKQGLAALIKDEIKNRKPFLGICLGMQLLFEKSEEANKCPGLGIIRGEVKKFPVSDLKVPHMGWNQLKQEIDSCPLLKGIAGGSYVYFCHSYYPQPKEAAVVAATTGYGMNFASIVWQDNVYGAQFHPEKSQGVGLKMLENFVNLC
ncbi:MAG: imidazole glycerol phosphate synthase subunit HisH [Candidatus Omnitrophica bacterium]|nr:imidazole glycerol phosphate synthase subunit HisH [Candidatus Omnitrophota bacterium]MDD5661959.1 imidazole glycerol phosphate synthase subunit HisH [Candidatus Omnitrophota bacterium]